MSALRLVPPPSKQVGCERCPGHLEEVKNGRGEILGYVCAKCRAHHDVDRVCYVRDPDTDEACFMDDLDDEESA